MSPISPLKSFRISVVVPLFNESDRLPEYAPQLADFVSKQFDDSELLFVDDGSSDDTVLIAEDFKSRRDDVQIRVLKNSHQGKGAALQRGLREATREILAFCDVDLSTPLADLRRIIEVAATAEVVAIGSRDLAASSITRHQSQLRESLGQAYNRFVQLALLPGILDTQCGAKAASRKLWDRILGHSEEAGFAWDVEILYIARRLGMPIQELAIEWQHDDRSKVNVFRDGIAMVRAIPRIRIRHSSLSALPEPSSEFFGGENAESLLASDVSHWWFRSKAATVAWILKERVSLNPRNTWLIDVGAGGGGVTSLLGWFPDRVLMIEGTHSLVSGARHRHGLLGVVAEGGNLPLKSESAGVITLLDVIEHIREPQRALTEAWEVVKPGGFLIVSVPAHQWLWSQADLQLGHFRRYSRSGLRASLESAGFKVELVTHFFSWLVLPVWLTRRLTRNPSTQVGLFTNWKPLDVIALLLTRIERLLLKRVSLPIGTSIIALAQRPLAGEMSGALEHGSRHEGP